MPAERIETPIPVSKRTQTHALERVPTGVGLKDISELKM